MSRRVVPQGWEKMQPYRNEKLTPSPLTIGLGRSPYGDRPRLDKEDKELMRAPHVKVQSRLRTLKVHRNPNEGGLR